MSTPSVSSGINTPPEGTSPIVLWRRMLLAILSGSVLFICLAVALCLFMWLNGKISPIFRYEAPLYDQYRQQKYGESVVHAIVAWVTPTGAMGENWIALPVLLVALIGIGWLGVYTSRRHGWAASRVRNGTLVNQQRKSPRPSTLPPVPPDRHAENPMIIQALQTQVTLCNCQARCLPSWTHAIKQEDRIFSGVLAKRYPVIILADGASNFAAQSGALFPGGGARAATIVCTSLITQLNDLLQSPSRVKNLESLMGHIARLIEDAERSLEQHNADAQTPGATTVLISLLYSPPGQPHAHWVYGYLGDGEIVIMSPTRHIKGWPAETWLLTPHKLGDQPVLLPRPASLKAFAPLVGSIPYQPGDILYATTDGIGFINQYLRHRRKLTFGQYLWNESFSPARESSVAAMQSRLPNPVQQYGADGLAIYDDVSVGAIWTEVTK